MSVELSKQFNPAEAQKRWYTHWESEGYFHSQKNPGRDAFSVVIPPPNVTGALHMGHALNGTLQDILVRFKRMQGFETLWIPGTDHAGIATQAMVEKRLREEENKNRHDLGRDALVNRIWQWKDHYESRILNQLKQIGCSCDWQRTRFTLDDNCARAVRETFFSLFRDGLIYRGKRLVNWDPHLQTAVADDEVTHEKIEGSLWTFRYPIADSKNHILISTTRPETMLGDTAVAVHPEDERYKHLIGSHVILPLQNRSIPVIADPILVKREFGTGAVKVTPAHDPNDYQCGQRHHLPMINILNTDGSINEQGGPYQGLDRYEARKQIIEDLKELDCVEKIEPYETEVGHSDRSKTPIEPYLSDEWFVRMSDLAQSAMDAVTNGTVELFPERYAKTYLDWLSEKRDWCISRHLWWGHRIPIWYCSTCTESDLKKIFKDSSRVTWNYDENKKQWLISSLDDLSPDALGPDHELERDPDVLDTWFSSALWPHSTLGWPDNTDDLDYYYPTNVLVTSRDIITLWVARMVITGLYNCKQIPFHQVYIHPKILDGQGRTMSKTRGNGVDPLNIIQKYGPDALRFSLAHLTTEQQDVRLPVSYECPHCGNLLPQQSEHQELRVINGRKPYLNCSKCKEDYQPSSPNFDPDPDMPIGILVSERFELGRNFANKLWNASRFLLMNLENYTPEPFLVSELPLEDRWILSRLTECCHQVTEQLDQYRFSEATRTLYDFTWNEFCDWYLEIIKPRLQQDDRSLAQNVLAGSLDVLLRLLHPFIPYVTEEIWNRLNQVAKQRGLESPFDHSEAIIIACWPQMPADWRDQQAETDLFRIQEMVTNIRNIRARFQVPQQTKVSLHLRCSQADIPHLIQSSGHLEKLARATLNRDHIGPEVTRPTATASFTLPGMEGHVPLSGLIDLEAERKRQEEQKTKIDARIHAANKKLSNPNYTNKAPQSVVQQTRDRLADDEKQRDIIITLLEQLSSN